MDTAPIEQGATGARSGDSPSLERVEPRRIPVALRVGLIAVSILLAQPGRLLGREARFAQARAFVASLGWSWLLAGVIGSLVVITPPSHVRRLAIGIMSVVGPGLILAMVLHVATSPATGASLVLVPSTIGLMAGPAVALALLPTRVIRPSPLPPDQPGREAEASGSRAPRTPTQPRWPRLAVAAAYLAVAIAGVAALVGSTRDLPPRYDDYLIAPTATDLGRDLADDWHVYESEGYSPLNATEPRTCGISRDAPALTSWGRSTYEKGNGSDAAPGLIVEVTLGVTANLRDAAAELSPALVGGAAHFECTQEALSRAVGRFVVRDIDRAEVAHVGRSPIDEHHGVLDVYQATVPFAGRTDTVRVNVARLQVGRAIIRLALFELSGEPADRSEIDRLVDIAADGAIRALQ